MIFNVIVFILGVIIGSFLNVCIYRLPKRESIFYPRSYCPHCKKPILWHDNIPLLSYLILKGRCRHCKERISIQYFFVELITACMFLFFFIYFKESLALFLIYVILGSALIVATFTDLQLKIIPDEITIGGTLAAFLLSIIYPAIHNTDLWFLAAGRSLLGMLVGGLSIYLAGVLGKIMFKKESMGAGDIKLLIMIGAFLGWKLTLLTFFIAPFFGAVVGIIVKIKTKQDIIPYGPFLSLACFVVILYGQQILDLLMPY